MRADKSQARLETEGPYDPAQIAEFNRRHDRYYGWSLLFPTIYTNNRRLPETWVGTIEQYWNARDAMLTAAKEATPISP